MSGILSGCSSMFLPMECDIYYANETQDDYGAIEKNWYFGATRSCSFYTMNDESNNENFSFDDKKFYRLETMLFGRVKDDLRKDDSGLYHPMSHILVTNIRKTGCGEELFFFETSEEYTVTPTIFEVKTVQPFIGVFSTVEYYKVQLERSDTQELNPVALRKN